MSHDEQLLSLIESARQNHADSLNQLVERVQSRVYAYINRATLDSDLAQDLTQEVLLAMSRALHDLDEIERFWPWVYRIAQRRILEHYRAHSRRSRLAKSKSFQHDMAQRTQDTDTDAADRLAKEDLARQTVTAMKSLQEQHRAVLSLRCFDQLTYSDIAAVMDCTEVKARVLFFRAKQALRKQLIGQGVDRYLLLACLSVFGELTAPADAATGTIAVTVTSTNVDLLTRIIARITGKWSLSAGAAAVALLGVFLGVSQMRSGLAPPILRDRSDVRSMHYTMQLSNAQEGSFSSLSKGAYEQWFYFPDGVDGPVFRRMQRWTPQQTRKQCAWLQNAQGHYYYASDYRTVTIHNYPIAWSSLNVTTLPTDPPEMAAFLEEVQNAYEGVTFTRDPNTQLLSGALDTRFADAMDFKTDYLYNTLDLDFFAYDWSDDIPLIDARDEMHRRGWTYFEVKGNIRDQTIIGQGRIPFTYGAYQENPAWMTLTVDNTLTISDTKEGAWIWRPGDASVTTYPSGAFFCGLMRPWMGLHTLDLVRRDAARTRRWFKTEKTPEEGYICVTVYDDRDQPRIELVYTIDEEHDLLKHLAFVIGGKDEGQLEFDYLDDVGDVNDIHVRPTTSTAPGPPNQPAPGLPWLFGLANGASEFPK